MMLNTGIGSDSAWAIKKMSCQNFWSNLDALADGIRSGFTTLGQLSQVGSGHGSKIITQNLTRHTSQLSQVKNFWKVDLGGP